MRLFFFMMFFIFLWRGVYGAATGTEPEAGVPGVVSIIHGDSTLNSANDRTFSKNRAIRYSRLLDSVGAASKVFSDTALDAALAPPCKVAHLVNVRTLPRAEFAKVKNFVDGGGKLIVHSSFDSAPEIADLFGIETPKQVYVAASGFSFIAKPPMHAPARVQNSVPFIFDTKPRTGSKAEIVARWDGSEHAAIIQAPAGFWITRMMMDDGGRFDKAKLLVALSGHCHADVWGHAARRLRAENPRLMDTAELRKKCPRAKRAKLDNQIAAFGIFDRLVTKKFEAKTLAAAMPDLWKMREYSYKARASATRLPLEGKIVAAWISSPSALVGDKGWEPVATRLRAAGVNAVFASVSALEWNPRDGSDTLASVFRAHGIKVHVWLQTCKPDPALRAELAKEKRLLLDSKGAVLDWYNPADNRNVADIKKTISDLTARFKPDGIHLDYIRYPTGYSVPKDTGHAAITALVREIRGSMTLADKNVRTPVLTAAVYQSGKSNGVGQSWYQWMREGLLDYAVPMNYTPSAEKLDEICATQAKNAPAKKLICGIGVNSFESNLNPAQTVGQTAVALSKKFGGVAYYHCDASFVSEAASVLELAR